MKKLFFHRKQSNFYYFKQTKIHNLFTSATFESLSHENFTMSLQSAMVEVFRKNSIFIIIKKLSKIVFYNGMATISARYSKLELDLCVYSATSRAKDDDLFSSNFVGELYSSIIP